MSDKLPACRYIGKRPNWDATTSWQLVGHLTPTPNSVAVLISLKHVRYSRQTFPTQFSDRVRVICLKCPTSCQLVAISVSGQTGTQRQAGSLSDILLRRPIRLRSLSGSNLRAEGFSGRTYQ